MPLQVESSSANSEDILVKVKLSRYTGLIVVAWIIALIIIGAIQATIPRRVFTYQAQDLATSSENLNITGFYPPELDRTGNRYSWTKGDSSLTFNFQTNRPFNLVIEARSAAVAGGMDAPVQVLVNGIEITHFQADPHNSAFQIFRIKVTPPSSDLKFLKIELKAATFKPAGDGRILGTMLKAVSVELDQDWNIVSSLLWLLTGLVGLVGLLWLISRFYNSSALNYGLELVYITGFGLTLLILYLLAGVERASLSHLYYAACLAGGSYLALLWWWAIIRQPLGKIPRDSLARHFYYSLKLDRQMGHSGKQAELKLTSIHSLTGLRYLAALLVFIWHLPYSSGLPEWLLPLKQSGYNGVSLFFVLSGFVICYNYYERISTAWLANLKLFFVSRFARIYPGYFLVFIFYYCAADSGFHSLYQRPPGLGVLISHLTLTQAWNTNQPVFFGFVGPAWSVSVEVFLYLSFPLITCLVLRYCQKIGQLLTVGAIAYVGQWALAIWLNVTQPYPAGYYWVYVFPVTNLTPFILGCVAARIYMKWESKPISSREALLGSIGLYGSIGAIAVIMVFRDLPWLIYPKWGAAYVLFFALIVFCLARYRSYLSCLLSRPFLVLLGEASYSFYLWHAYFLDVNRGRLENSQDLGSYLYGLLVLLVLTATSVGLFLMIETPSRRFIRKLAKD